MAEHAFVFSNFVTNLGSGILLLGSAYVTFDKEHSSSAVGLLFVLAALPQGVLSLISAQLIRPAALKAVCVSADFLRAACCGALLYLQLTGHLAAAALYTGTFAVSCADALSIPGMNAWAQQEVQQDNYRKFSKRFELGSNIGGMLSAAAGGLIIGLVGIEFSYAANVATYLLSALVLGLARHGRVSQLGDMPIADEDETAVGVDSATGAHAAVRDRAELKRWVMLFAQGRTVALVVTSLLVPLVLRDLDRSVTYLGAVDAVAGVGVLITVRVSSGWLAADRDRRAVLGLIVAGLLTIPLGLVGQWGMPLLFACSAGVFGLARIGAREALMTACADTGSRRSYALANALSLVLGAALTLLLGYLVDATSTSVGFICIGCWLVVVSVSVGGSLLRSRESMERFEVRADEVRSAK